MCVRGRQRGRGVSVFRGGEVPDGAQCPVGGSSTVVRAGKSQDRAKRQHGRLHEIRVLLFECCRRAAGVLHACVGVW